jgi:hypothetical protein
MQIQLRRWSARGGVKKPGAATTTTTTTTYYHSLSILLRCYVYSYHPLSIFYSLHLYHTYSHYHYAQYKSTRHNCCGDVMVRSDA